MAESEVTKEKETEGSVSADKNVVETPQKGAESVVKEPENAGKSVKKQDTTENTEDVKEGGQKVERNSDGTFTKGHTPYRNVPGRPIQQFSYRAMAKVRAGKDPERVSKDLMKLDEIIDSEETSPMEKMKALEFKIKLNGGFDPVENKDVTERVMPESPLNGLTIEELRTLKALKKGKKK